MKKNNYFEYSQYINVSRMFATQGNCKKRNYGCIIVSPKGDILSAGCTHSTNPCEKCKRRFARRGHGYDKCTSIHAEQQCLTGVAIPEGSTAFLTCFDAVTKREVVDPRPCPTCERLLRLAGIKKVITLTEVIEL